MTAELIIGGLTLFFLARKKAPAVPVAPEPVLTSPPLVVQNPQTTTPLEPSVPGTAPGFSQEQLIAVDWIAPRTGRELAKIVCNVPPELLRKA